MGSHRHTAYRPDIDGLRAVAVVSVILFHLGFGRFSGGYVGVDVFFVISGFLITGYILADLEAGTFSFARFYVRRVRRLFPALFFTLSVSFLVASFLFSPDHLQGFSRSLLASLGSVSNFLFWNEAGYFDTRAHFKPLLHTWSLSVEEQFYLVWPLTLTALWKFGRSRAVLSFLAVSALISLYFTQQWLRTDSVGAFYLAPFRVTEFAIGAICVWLVRFPPKNWVSELLAVVGLLAVAYSVFAFDQGTEFPGINALIPCLGTAAWIYGGKAKYLGSLLRNRLAVGTGLISYSLYLAHWPIYVFYRYWRVDPLTRPERIGIIVASFAAAVLMFFYVEKPFRATADKVGTLRPAAFAAVCVPVALLLALPAVSAWQSSGWNWRIPPDVAQAVGDLEEYNRGRRRIIRSPTCHMSAGYERFKATFPSCLEMRDDRRNVMVMGDSHAADLWAALHAAYPDVNQLQATGAGCVPIEDSYRDEQHACRRLLHYVKNEFAGLPKVDGIILSARWPDRFSRVQADIDYYKSLGIPVVVFGPVLEFEPDVRTLTYRFGKLDGLDAYVDRHRVDDIMRLDREMMAFFSKRHVPYVSKIGIFCGSDGKCPLLDRNQRLLIQDYGHWGVEAAEYFGHRLARQFQTTDVLFAGQ